MIISCSIYKKKKIIYYFLLHSFKYSLYIAKKISYNNNYFKKIFQKLDLNQTCLKATYSRVIIKVLRFIIKVISLN
jgi:hypothetical protein